jgi:ArsR family transcriptional regulator
MPVDIDREVVERLVREGVPLVEVLPHDEYADEHLPGAINIPLAELGHQVAVEQLDRERPVVVYCHDCP